MRIAATLALTMTLVASCSSSDSNDSGGTTTFSCDNAKSKCPNDPPLPPEECKAATGDPKCGNLAVTYFLCVGAHQTCLDNGTTDQSVTNRECSKEHTAVTDCFSADGGPRF